MARISWKQTAELLARQLAAHADCEAHVRFNPDCPSCCDRAAYLAYLAAGGRDFRPQEPELGSVTLDELVRRSAE